MRTGEWIFFSGGKKGVSLAWTPGLLSKSRFLHMHEPGSGANRPICMFCPPLGTYLFTYYTCGSDSWRNLYCWVFPIQIHILKLLAVTLRALLKNTSDISWMHFSGQKSGLLPQPQSLCLLFFFTLNNFCPSWGFLWDHSSPTIQQFLKHENNCTLKKQSAGLLRFTYNWRHHVVC